jgi:Protein kinase domain
MSLSVGTLLGAHEITALLGKQGGMGEVYRATDSKLGRSVAIKVLPEAVASDAERIARFEREARVLASLNHSNIAAIYGLDFAFACARSVGKLTEPARTAIDANRTNLGLIGCSFVSCMLPDCVL